MSSGFWTGEAEWEAESVLDPYAERIRQQYRLALPRAIPLTIPITACTSRSNTA